MRNVSGSTRRFSLSHSLSGALLALSAWLAGCSGSQNSGPGAVSLSASTLPFHSSQALSGGVSTDTGVLVLTNTGAGPLQVTQVNVLGPAANAFQLTPGSCVGTLASGASCRVSLHFVPTSASAVSNAQLVFTDDAEGIAGSTQTVSLTGYPYGEVHSIAHFGDSITCGFYAQPNDGTGLVYSTQGYAGLFDTVVGVPAENWCRQGDTAADLSRQWVPLHSSPTATDYQLYTVMIGSNDGYRYGIPDTALNAYTAEAGAALAWLAMPSKDKVLASAAMQAAGNWSSDVGPGMMSADTGAALRFNVTQAVAGRQLYVVYHVWAEPSTIAGKAAIAVDGAVVATVDESYDAWAYVPTENGTRDTFLLKTVPLGAAGAHTVTFTSAGAPGTSVGLLWAGVPQTDYQQVAGAPRVLAGMVPTSPSGNQAYVATVFSQQLKTLIPLLNADGLNVVVVPTDTALDPGTDFADILHPNNAGHAKLAAVFERYR